MKFIISFGTLVVAASATSTTEQPSSTPCVAGDFELIGLVNPSEIVSNCTTDAYPCMNAQIAAIDGYSERSIEQSCYNSIWVDNVIITSNCCTASDSPAKQYLCNSIFYFDMADVQAAQIEMYGACDQQDMTTLSTGNYSALASCVADDQLGFSTCLTSYPLDASENCNAVMNSAFIDIESNCSDLCGTPPDYSDIACTGCMNIGLPVAASTCAYNSTYNSTYNSASPFLKFSFMGILIVLVAMN